jgi:hypothetical protein
VGVYGRQSCRHLWADYLEKYGNLGPPLWSSGQSSWLQIQRSRFDFRRYQIFWEVVGLERGPLSLLNTIEELLGRNSSSSGLENRDYDRRGFAALTMRHPSTRKPGTNFTDKRRSLGRYSSLAESTTEFILFVYVNLDVSQPYGPPQPVTGFASPSPFTMSRYCLVSICLPLQAEPG